MDTQTSELGPGLINAANEVAARAYEAYDPLIKLFTDRFRSAGVYAVKHRRKNAHDIADKVARRKKYDPKYDANQVTDSIGIRFVTLFQASIPDVLSHLVEFLLEQNGDITIGKEGIREIEPYSNRHENDPLSIDKHVRRVVHRLGLRKKLIAKKPSRSGYSSVHVVIRPLVRCRETAVSTFVEIQIRSVFEDAWSEISHRAAYAAGRATQILEGIDIEPPQAEHLNVLKSFVDASIQYADLISESLGGAPFRMGSLGLARARDYVPPDVNEALGLQPPITRMLFQEAEDRLERAFNANFTSDRRRFLAIAADRFQRCREEIESSSLKAAQKKAVLRFLDMESGLCLNIAGSSEENDRAIKIFQRIVDEDPADPVALYRLGISLSDSGSAEQGIQKMEDAFNKIRRSGSASHANWLDWAVPRNLALAYWRASRTASRSEKVALLTQAYVMALKGLNWERRKGKRDNVSLHNIIYYNSLLVGETKSEDKTIWLKSLKKHVAYWEANFERLGQDHVRELHSLMLAYEILSDLDRATRLAKHILRLFARSSGGVIVLPGKVSEQLMERTLDEDEREVVRDCWRILGVEASPDFVVALPGRLALPESAMADRISSEILQSTERKGTSLIPEKSKI
jgi:ppGpp synthetase/RelA/SpoT-type nucleotidyltranferase